MGVSQNKIPIFYTCASVFSWPTLTSSCTVKSDIWYRKSFLIKVYMCANRLSNKANMCGKSRLSHDMQENFLLSRCISTFKTYTNTRTTAMPCKTRVVATFSGKLCALFFHHRLIPRKRWFCHDMTKTVDRDVKLQYKPLTEKKSAEDGENPLRRNISMNTCFKKEMCQMWSSFLLLLLLLLLLIVRV